jgi:hypothetical protein
MLPLAKLCAMVTMKKPGETSIQSFSLPLSGFTPSDSTDGTNDTSADNVMILHALLNCS